MPMIELTTTKGALDDDAKQLLAGELASLALELEAGSAIDFSGDEHMQALAWCFVNEQEVFVGGRQFPKPIYRVVFSLPEGAPGLFGPLAAPGREALVKRATAAVLAAEGSENTMVEAHRVWVQLRQIDHGHWGGCGEIVTVSDLALYALKADKPGSKTARIRDAVMESIGATSPA